MTEQEKKQYELIEYMTDVMQGYMTTLKDSIAQGKIRSKIVMFDSIASMAIQDYFEVFNNTP